MAGKATTIDQQIDKLQKRGVIINDIEYAKKALFDIGYYHLGFYFFPFEKTYPFLDKRRCHDVREETYFEDAVALHQFDSDLRSILLRYTSQIELAFRTSVIYFMSIKYPSSPNWYLSKTIVDETVVEEILAGYGNIRKNDAIQRHHQNHRKSKHAPAWKTLEFETLGVIQKVYEGIIKVDDKLPINRRFGVPDTSKFAHYIDLIRQLRNACAHGNIIYDIRLSKSIEPGPAGNFVGPSRQRLAGLLGVAKYLLSQISTEDADKMRNEIGDLFKSLCKCKPHLKCVVEGTTKLNLTDFE